MEKISETEKDRRDKISVTMKERFRKNPSEFDRIRKSSIKRKQNLGYVNSLKTRKILSSSLSKMWKEGRVTDKQKKTLFITGEDSRRMNTQFKKGHEVPPSWRAIVKETRKNQIFPLVDSKIEVKIQNYLKQLGMEFYAHQYMDIEHGYQCDILIPSMRTVIECNGDYWHNYPYGNEVDLFRCKELRDKGFRVLVFWENEIKVMELNDFKSCLMKKW